MKNTVGIQLAQAFTPSVKPVCCERHAESQRPEYCEYCGAAKSSPDRSHLNLRGFNAMRTIKTIRCTRKGIVFAAAVHGYLHGRILHSHKPV